MEGKAIARVFWPAHSKHDNSSGYLIGWNIRSFIGCVACVINTDLVEDPRELEKALERVAEDERLQDIHKYCHGPPIMLGLWNLPEEEEDRANFDLLKSFVDQKKQTEDFWLSMSLRNPDDPKFITKCKRNEDYQFLLSPTSSRSRPKTNELEIPHLTELYCFGYQYVADSQIISYRLPSPDHYFSCTPLSLDLFHKNESASLSNINDSELENTLHQVNCSLIIEAEIRKAIEQGKSMPKDYDKNDININSKKDKKDIEIENKDESFKNEENDDKNEDVLFDASQIHKDLLDSYRYHKRNLGIMKRFVWQFIIFVSLISVFGHALHDKIFSLLPIWLVNILDSSATIQQLRIRLTWAKQIPWVWIGLHQKWRNHPQTRRFKVNFYNMFSVFIIDTFLGIFLACFITYYANEVVSVMNAVTRFFTERIIEANIKWLMGWPAGFKLNDNVDSFMGQLFLFYSYKWTEILHTVPISYHTFVVLTSSTGMLGLSMMLSTISDLLFICVLHINWFYNGSARVYMHQLQAISGLWKLFRGKKRNVLRNRIDSCHYDIDQLLLGTILFSVLFFLLPTVAIYYLYFSLVRFLVFCVHAIIFFLLQVLNHFPIYGITLYLLDSSYFTGGIFFKIIGHSQISSSFSRQTSAYFYIQDQPSSFGCVFYYYSQWISDFFKNNSVKNIISCALFGMPIQLIIHAHKHL